MPAQNKATEPDMARNRIAPFLQWKTALSGTLSACSANLTQYIKESIRPEAKPVGPNRSAAGIRLCTCDPCRWRRPYFRKSAVFSNLLRNGYTDAFTWKYSENSTVRRIRYNGPTPTYAALRKSFLALSGPLSSFTHPTYTGEYCHCF